MGDLSSGTLTLLAFLVLLAFAIIATWSLRRHIRRIEVPREAELREREAADDDTEITEERR